MDNLLYYKLAPPRPGGIQYALALVSNVGNGNFMIDYVESIGLESVEDYRKVLRKLATLAYGATFSATPAKRPVLVTDEDTLCCGENEKTSTEPDRCQFAGQGSIQGNVEAWCLLRCFRAQLRSRASTTSRPDFR